MIRVVVADDQTLVRAGFASLLDAEDDIEVVGEAADGEEAVRIAARSHPDVVLMDIRMPVLDGDRGHPAYRQGAAGSGLGARRDRDHLSTLMSTSSKACGPAAAGFLLKDTGAPELLRAVRVAASGEALPVAHRDQTA